jgi:hypothetical protein
MLGKMGTRIDQGSLQMTNILEQSRMLMRDICEMPEPDDGMVVRVDLDWLQTKVESLLEAHRKQVLLEAAVICEARGSLLPDLSDESLTAFDLCAELRRMAEGDKE